MSTIERLLDIYISSVIREGERFAKIKSLSLSLEILNGARKITMVYFFAFLSCVFFVASLFSMIMYAAMMYSKDGYLHIDTFSTVMLSICVLSLGYTVFFLREKRWLQVFGLQEKITDYTAAASKGLHHLPT